MFNRLIFLFVIVGFLVLGAAQLHAHEHGDMHGQDQKKSNHVTQQELNPEAESMTIGQLRDKPMDMHEKLVKLEGEITSICMMRKCWFTLRDDSGEIFIDLAPNNLVMPLEHQGKRVAVTGVVKPREDMSLKIEADAAELR